MAVKTKDSITVYHVMDIDSVTWYYKLQPSTAAAPAKPTTDPPPSGWVTAEPTYTEGSTNSLYIVEKTVYSDGTFTYSDVSLSSSYEAAKTAYNKSVAAQAVAANAQTVAANAAKTATKYITDLTDGIFVAPEGQGPNDTQTPTGWKIQDALELLQTGISYIWAGITNGVAGVRIGKQDEGNVFLSGSGYVDVRKSSTVLAHFGYDEGIALDGSIQVAPYYNLGIRKANTTIGNYSTAEGYSTEAANFCSHAEGYATLASGSSAHAEGSLSKATGNSSHAEGSSTAEGADSHAEGGLSKASGDNAHAEGSLTNAEGLDSHAEGTMTKSSGQRSHAEGYSCQALGDNSHAEGHDCYAYGVNSHASGYGCSAKSDNQTVIGKYNVADNANTYAFIIGRGTGLLNRYNALTVDWNGHLDIAAGLSAGSSCVITRSEFAQFLIDVSSGSGKIAEFRTKNNLHEGAFHLSAAGNLGIYSYTNSKWVIYMAPNGRVYIPQNIYAGTALGTGGKTAWNDTEHDGTWITSSGEIHISKLDNHGGQVAFHYNGSASATVMLTENTSGVLTCSGDFVSNGNLQFKDYTGTARRPVSSAATDGKRVGYFMCNTATQLGINGQWGTTGTTYSTKYVSVSTSDIRLKKNVEDCTADALSAINQIRMRQFDWLYTGEHQKIGMIADELENIDPKLSMGGDAEKDGTINYKSVDTFYLIGYLVKAVQELSAEVEALKREVNLCKDG